MTSEGVQDSVLPYCTCGRVVKGFGRGSKELGIPTANFPEEVVEELPASLCSGVYYGWARVDDGDVHKMVMSVGWNPQYQNEKRSMETHIMHKYPEDFYNSQLSVCVVGYIRNEMKFDSLDKLIEAIHNDISVADSELDKAINKDLAAKLMSHSITNHNS